MSDGPTSAPTTLEDSDILQSTLFVLFITLVGCLALVSCLLGITVVNWVMRERYEDDVQQVIDVSKLALVRSRENMKSKEMAQGGEKRNRQHQQIPHPGINVENIKPNKQQSKHAVIKRKKPRNVVFVRAPELEVSDISLQKIRSKMDLDPRRPRDPTQQRVSLNTRPPFYEIGNSTSKIPRLLKIPIQEPKKKLKIRQLNQLPSRSKGKSDPFPDFWRRKMTQLREDADIDTSTIGSESYFSQGISTATLSLPKEIRKKPNLKDQSLAYLPQFTKLNFSSYKH